MGSLVIGHHSHCCGIWVLLEVLVNAHDSKAKMMLRTCGHVYPTRDGPPFMHPKKECPYMKKTDIYVNFKAIVGF